MLPAREPNGPLFDHQEVDVVVVGAGFMALHALSDGRN